MTPFFFRFVVSAVFFFSFFFFHFHFLSLKFWFAIHSFEGKGIIGNAGKIRIYDIDKMVCILHTKYFTTRVQHIRLTVY